MPHATIKFSGGVNEIETPVLNQAGVSSCNLVRYRVDGNFVLLEKLGGWQKYFPNQLVAPGRALWAWQDTEAISYLAAGTENQTLTYEAQLSIISDGGQRNITPRSVTDNITAAASSTVTSSIITITDATTQNITNFVSVYIPVHISIGGIVLFGMYPCNPDGHFAATTWTVQALDKLGNPLAATGTSSAPTLPLLSATNGSSAVTVTLVGHGYVVGDTYPVLVSTTVGGVVFYGNYLVQTVVDADNFTITGTTQATATTTGRVNHNKARYIYQIGIGAIPPGTGYGIGGYGRGGYGSGSAVIPPTGRPISAIDWTLDNWGEILTAVPVTTPIELTTLTITGNGTTASATFSQAYTPAVGEDIVISGVTPVAWNGTYTVTASSSGSVSFLSATTSPQTAPGTILVLKPPLQPIYVWNPQSGAPIAMVIPQAPPVNDGHFVAMPQRQIVMWGSTFTGILDPLLLRWCDVANYFRWIGQPQNQAGSYRIPRGSRIVAGLQGPQQGIIWTDIGVWSMQYIGQPYIYSFNEVGTGCGLIGRKAAATLDNDVYWMGPSNFYRLGDGGIETIPCPIWDVVFQNIDTDFAYKIRVAVNSRFNEIAWYYPTTNSNGEVTSYVKYNVLMGPNGWDFGTLSRSAWIDQSVLGPPIGTDPTTRYIYQHETSPDADGSSLNATLRTGYAAIAEGDRMTFLDQVWPDMKFGYYGGMQNATLNLTFYAADYPGDTPQVYGPFTYTQATQWLTPRIRARLISVEISSTDVGSWWRIGGMRYRFAEDGRY